MNLQTRIFLTARQVAAFVNDPANSVTTVVSITFDATSGQFVLFFQ